MMQAAYWDILQNPGPAGRGYTRWWWYGCAVERGEITRELDLMRQAGIGGVELQILYAVSADSPDTGVRNIPYFSPEFFDIVAFTAEECHRRGMGFDFTPGSSWPFGGPFVRPEDTMECAIPYQFDIQGPCRWGMDLTTYVNGAIACASMGRMDGNVMAPDTVADITGRVVEKQLFGWPWGHEVLPMDIPKGLWKVTVFVIHLHRNQVGKPGRGAHGPVIDHCSRRAMDNFLANMVEPVAERLGHGAVGSFFCDSIEVEGHNWSGVLLEEFHRRRGYRLEPYAYALWGEVGDLTGDIRYDYFRTMSELTIENFFEALTEFSHKHGALSRIQAHGTWGDILRAYGAADIPEGETFGDHRHLEVNTIHRRLAVSAGHLYGRNIISNETFTWLKRPRFTETPEDLKAAVDAVFADGCNRIVNHGYAYSPESSGRLGQPFYASSHLNHTLPWWKHYRHLGAYIHRVSALLQTGRPVVEVGVYLPQADIWADNKMCDLHLAMRLEEHIGRDTADHINKAGYWFDYLNDEALTHLGEMAGGGLVVNGNRYRAIVLIGCTRLAVETARALERFVQAGGTLICAEHIPVRGCGLVNRDEHYRAVARIMERTFRQPNALLVENRRDAVVRALRRAFAPDVACDRSDCVGYVHRQGDDGAQLYFVTNISPGDVRATLWFRGRENGFTAVNLETAKPRPVGEAAYGDGGCRVVCEFAPYESVLFLFSDDQPARAVAARPGRGPGQALAVTGLRLRVPERGIDLPLDQPTGWQEICGLEDYAGEGEYTGTFALQAAPGEAVLAIGRVDCACAVEVNGRDCGTIWKRPYTLDITAAVRAGENQIHIRATSPICNAVFAPEAAAQEPTVLAHWPYFGQVINNTREARMSLQADREALGAPQPAGISGELRVLIRNTH